MSTNPMHEKLTMEQLSIHREMLTLGLILDEATWKFWPIIWFIG